MMPPTLQMMSKETSQTYPDRTPVKKWAKVRLWAGYVYLACTIVLSRPTLCPVIIGVLLILLGAGLRLVASATLVKDRELCTSGIYAVTRNPLYLGSAMVGLGFAVLSNSIWIYGFYFLILVPLYARMILLEEKYLCGLYPEEYPRYRKSIPGFFPRQGNIARMFDSVDKDKLFRNREISSTILFIIITVIIIVWHGI